VVRTAGYTVLQYWYFYPFNDWRSTFYGVNDHEADWETVTVYLVDDPDAHTTPDGLRPAWVAASAHDVGGPDLRRRWDGDNPDQRDGKHRDQNFFHGFKLLLTRAKRRQTNLGVHHVDETWCEAGLSHEVHGKESGEAVQGPI